jgi:DNA-binding MltR family transcriptional regulator
MLTGYRTLIVAAVWLAYQIAAVVVPDLQTPDQPAVETMVDALLAIAGPLVVAILRLRTTGPVGPAIQQAPLIGTLAKSEPKPPEDTQ